MCRLRLIAWDGDSNSGRFTFYQTIEEKVRVAVGTSECAVHRPALTPHPTVSFACYCPALRLPSGSFSQGVNHTPRILYPPGPISGYSQ
jgi:hypothetical protein